ncbi:MAG: Rieske (2Fe-2S) protein [Thaumarchaeota archaeon]|nr:Rieske (2Fe-2S) protein [Nitrososphaerota archaeon]
MNRREFIRRIAVSTVFVGIAMTGAYEFVEKFAQVSPTQNSEATVLSQSSQSSGQVSSPAGYAYVGQVTDIGASSSAYFTHPKYGNSILIKFNGQWKAFVATCTHAPCTVQFTGSSIYCPCHDGQFDPNNGAVTRGPPPRPLPEFSVLVQNGSIFVLTT